MSGICIDSVHIGCVRHLRDITIPVSSDGQPRHLILTGKNGSGKTSVLDAIASYIDAVSLGDYSLDSRRYGINLTFNIDNADVYGRYKAGDCVFAHFKARRQFAASVPTQIEKVVFDERYAIDDSPRTLFIKYLLDLKMTQALAASGGKPDRADEIQQWFDRVRDILRDIYEDSTLTLEFDENTFQFSIHTQGREPFDFNGASDGFSAVIDIVADLMMRMVHKNSRATNFDMPGIALVDEIENHLHLSLQRRVLPMLTSLFPNIQFIVTTHSPFVLSSLSGAVVYDLETHTLVQDGLANNTYASIVEGYYNVDSLSAELREKYDRYQELAAREALDDGEFLEARQLELYLDEIPDYLALGIATEYKRAKLELHNKVAAR